MATGQQLHQGQQLGLEAAAMVLSIKKIFHKRPLYLKIPQAFYNFSCILNLVREVGKYAWSVDGLLPSGLHQSPMGIC